MRISNCNGDSAADHAVTPIIMHVDIDAFFASIEQLRNPRLRGKPVVVGSGVIASCSYEARKYGLCAGMPLHQAKRLCPHAVVLKGHQPTYQCFAEQIFDVCRQIAPGVETYLDEAYADLTGTDGLYGHPLNAGRMLKQAVRDRTGLTVSVGLATNRMVAKMAGGAAKPDGLQWIEPGTEQDFVAQLPVHKLPGVGYARRLVMEKLNVQTIGELRGLSRQALEGLFGSDGLVLHDRCRGQDTRVVGEREIPNSISRETTFHRETLDPTEINAMLFYLTERAARTLRRLGLTCRRLRVHLRYADSASASRTRTLRLATDLDRDLFATANELLESIYTRRVCLRLIGVTLSHFGLAGARQADLFDEPRNGRLNDLYRCLDTLRDKFGHSVIVAGGSLDLLGKLRQDSHGYVLRTPCLTK